MIRNLPLVGGDRRALYLEELLKTDGYQVDTLGLHPGDEKMTKAAYADALLFGYPFSVRDGCIPTMTGMTIHPEDVLKEAKKNAVILAGRGLKEDGHSWRRYAEVEALEERNAEISAEAAVCEAMQRMDRALMDAAVMVVGYGRFGRALAKRLKALGAEVWVAARREEQRLLAANDGLCPIAISEICRVLPRMHMLLNTVPAQVLGERELACMQPGSWLMELASAPYGFDRRQASAHGLNCDILPSLPARCAPLSAAIALKKTTVKLLKEAEA